MKTHDNYEEIIEKEDKLQKAGASPKEQRSPRRSDQSNVKKVCFFFENTGKCKYGESCFKRHPTEVCEYFSKCGKCPEGDTCPKLHKRGTQEDCPFWMSGFCKFSNCGKVHDPKKKGDSTKRGRDNSPVSGPAEKKMKESDLDKNIEQRFQQQQSFLELSLIHI